MDLPALIAQQMQPSPDMPKTRRPTHPTEYATQFVNGRWVLVPVKYGQRPTLGPPKVTVTPIRRKPI